jgi:hypothetical protein
MPLETKPVTNPRGRASAKISAAHSAVMSGSLNECLRAHVHGGGGRRLVPERLRRHPVLAIAAVEVAPQHPERQRVGAGEHVKERLFLDRVALDAGGVAVGYPEPAALVVADPADSAASLADEAAVAARHAAQCAVGERLP